jgi:predicted transposase/invertase (TIGR01784 family)
LLRLKGKQEIEELLILPPEQTPFIKGEKKVIIDVKCRDLAGNQYIVEMQNRVVPEFFKRCQFYTSYAYVTQLANGERYFQLAPVVLLSICNQDLFPESEYLSFHKTVNVDNGKQYLKDIGYVFVELQKFNKTEEQLETLEEKWLYFLKNAHTHQDIPSKLKEQPIVEAFKALERFSWNTVEYDRYIEGKLFDEGHYGALELAEEKGKIKGLKEGKAKGLKEGEARGKLEEKRAIAQSMIKDGMNVSVIVKYTCLSKEQIQEITKGKI